MQKKKKSLRAGTKRPLTMVLVNAFWSFTSCKLELWRPEGWQGWRAWAWNRLVQPGLAWVSLGVAGCGEPRHVALWVISFLMNERSGAERQVCSHRTLWENIDAACSEEKQKTKRPENVSLKTCQIDNQPPTNRKMSVGKGTRSDIQYIKYVHNIGWLTIK